jgi:site-specific DNA recombinase
MIPRLNDVHSAVALYRVSTREQEKRGESLFNQERDVHKWADANGIQITQEIKTAESGKSALRLIGGSFQFDRRLGYARLIKELQNAPPAARPDAVVIDWRDRWSRNVLEYVGIIKAFQHLGIRVLSVGDGKDLTDPDNALMLQVMAVIAEEQLRVTSGKVKEARRSRRERKLWQGGSAPDGYRTHVSACPGRVDVSREGPDTRRSFRQRACNCRPDVLYIDPAREGTIRCLWDLLETSPMSWRGIAEQMNERGHRRPDGKPWNWSDVYRIGENPHYCGTLATNRSFRDAFDGTITRRRPLLEQDLVTAPEAIPHPFVTEATFWSVWKRRYKKQTRHLTRAKNGASSELCGLVACPDCGSTMTTTYALSSKTCGNGQPRKSPRKRYVYLSCPKSKVVNRSSESNCQNRQKFRADVLSRKLIDDLARLVELSDEALIEAMRIERRSSVDVISLAEEKRTLARTAKLASDARHALTRQLVAGVLTDAEFQAEMFRFRADAAQCEARISAIDESTSRASVRPDLRRARKTVEWLSEKWTVLTVCERAEALRLLIHSVTYEKCADGQPMRIRILSSGSAFADSASSFSVPSRVLVETA